MRTDVLAAALAAALALGALPAKAQQPEKLGACKQDEHETLVCGDQAARVVPNTLSRDKRLGFAWRDPDGSIDGETSGSDNELLLVRIADGAVLAKGKTNYFHTGEMRANRIDEEAVWSPDGRLAVRINTGRFSTDWLESYAVTPNGARADRTDFFKMVSGAIDARVRATKRNSAGYAFFVEKRGRRFGNDGTLRFIATVAAPRQEPIAAYDCRIAVPRRTGGSVQIVSIRRVSVPP